MSNFFAVLYSNPKFPVYLGTVMVVLVISFFIVFFLGNRDKKNIEKIQELKNVNNNSFQSVYSNTQIDETKTGNNVVENDNEVDLPSLKK